MIENSHMTRKRFASEIRATGLGGKVMEDIEALAKELDGTITIPFERYKEMQEEIDKQAQQIAKLAPDRGQLQAERRRALDLYDEGQKRLKPRTLGALRRRMNAMHYGVNYNRCTKKDMVTALVLKYGDNRVRFLNVVDEIAREVN